MMVDNLVINQILLAALGISSGSNDFIVLTLPLKNNSQRDWKCWDCDNNPASKTTVKGGDIVVEDNGDGLILSSQTEQDIE